MRRYYRVAHEGTTSVLSLYPEPFDPDRLSFLVVRNLMAGWGLPVPEVLDIEGPLGIVILEDLGNLTLQEALRGAGAARRTELYRQALDQLVVLQREAARAPQSAGCYQIAFDFEKLSWEMHFFWKHFLEGYRKHDLSVEDRASVADGFHRLCSEIASWPRVLTHRDFHSRNLMCHRDALFWIDFQDARMGPPHYDLASLLRDSYVDLDEDFVAELTKRATTQVTRLRRTAAVGLPQPPAEASYAGTERRQSWHGSEFVEVGYRIELTSGCPA